MFITRKMTLEDIEKVHEIENSTFSEPWSKEAFHNEITSKNKTIYIVVEKNTQILAYAGLWNVLGEGYITNIAVRKNSRGQGLGKLLINNLLKQGKIEGVKDFSLEVRVSNKKAINLYEKFGFKIVGERKNFYDKPTENAYIMWKYQK